MKQWILPVTLSLFLLNGCADAGADKTVNGGDTVQLDGTDSTADKGGKIMKYLWSQKKRDKVKVLLKDNPGPKPTFVAPYLKEKRKLHFVLKTYEYYRCRVVGERPQQLPLGVAYVAATQEICRVNISRDSVEITVRASSKTVRPSVVAEVNQTEVALGEPVTFSAKIPEEQSSNIVSYLWEEDSRVLSTDSEFEYTFSTEGKHTVKVTVTDSEEQNATDSVTVTVEGDLKKPIAKIKTNKSTVAVLESVTFDANSSSDSDGRIASYIWKDGNGTVLNENVKFQYAFNLPGKHTISLTVTDDDALSATDSVTITVTDNNGS